MSVNYSEELSQAFVVGPNELKKLVGLLEKRIGKVSFSAECIDKIQREFTTVKDLIDYENSKSKRICRIYLSARSEDYSKSATIAFRDSSSFSGGVSLSITANEDVVLQLKDKMLDIVVGTRPWYNLLAHSDLATPTGFVFYLLFCVVVIVLNTFIAFKFGLISDSKEGMELGDQLMSFIWLTFIIFFILYFAFFSKLLKRLFPLGIFAIGQGKSQYETLERIQWCVVIAFMVSLAAGVVLLIFK